MKKHPVGENARHTVLITGAGGSVGAKLRRYLAGCGRYELRLLDLYASDHEIIPADLSRYDDDWARHFVGVDSVIHLAGNCRPDADWAGVTQANIDLSLNVLRAATKSGCKKLIFASSNWVLAGYRFTSERLTTDLPPRPINAYGASKLFIERAGIEAAARTSLTFIAFRIGYCQHEPGNLPGPHMEYGIWGQQMWLSDRDLCAGMEAALETNERGAMVLNLMSNNRGMRWDMERTRTRLGFEPQDGHTAVATQADEEDAEVERRGGKWDDSL